MLQNLQADQLELSAEDIARIDAMDGTEREIKHPNSFWH
jgi:diketogulonate reductase-like aldo/keto reductase